MAESFGTGTPKDKDVVVLYKGEQKEVFVNPIRFRGGLIFYYSL